MSKSVRLKGAVDSITLGERAVTLKFHFPLDADDPQGHVGQVWKRYSRRRLVGNLLRGEEDPDQKMIEEIERTILSGPFDTNYPGFNADTAKLSLTFEANEVAPETLWRMRYSDAWLVIDEFQEIPAKSSDSGPSSEELAEQKSFDPPKDDWRTHPVTKTKLTAAKVESLRAGGITECGQLVEMIVSGKLSDAAKGFGLAGVKMATDNMRQYVLDLGEPDPFLKEDATS